MKGPVDVASLRSVGLAFYGWSLLRAHARTGDAVAILAYPGTSDRFHGAIADVAETHAELNEPDHKAYLAAIEAGRVPVSASS